MTFNFNTSEALKAEGMARAANARLSDLQQARSIARLICRQKSASGFDAVTNADEVGTQMEQQGLDGLGPAAGSLFKTKEFEFTGRRIRSVREKNHARELKVWRLRGW